MDRIIGIGNALVDVLVRLEGDDVLARLGLPRGGMQLIDEERQQDITGQLRSLRPVRSTGGSAGNAVLALANLGARPGFIGRVGEDEMGQFFCRNCQEVGIDARLIVGQGLSGVANTFITPDAERTFATYLGVAGQLQAGDITPKLLRDYQLLHVEGYLVQNHALIRHICRLAKEQGMRVSIDLASYNVVSENLSLLRELVEEYIDIVFANEEESAAFTGGKTPEQALQEIAGMADVAVVKLGKRGATAMQGGHYAMEPGRSENVVDTTAAGDFFAGGFLYALTCGASLEQCLRMGTLLASRIIQVVGTRLPENQWAEIRTLAHEILEGRGGAL
ncbi:MAG: adenosine kinase [Bacteroidaceae bacterium]|nr:adenosine kinase [Bacteroidaceae bacterium]